MHRYTVLGVALGLAFFSDRTNAAQPDQKKVEAGIKAYYAALEKMDGKAIAACLAENFLTEDGLDAERFIKQMQGYFKVVDSLQYTFEIIRYRNVNEANVVARLIVKTKLRMKGDKTDDLSTSHVALQMVQEKDHWTVLRARSAAMDLLFELSKAKTPADRKKLLLAETDDFLADELLTKAIFSRQTRQLAAGQYASFNVLQDFAEEAAAALRDPALRKRYTDFCLLNRANMLAQTSMYDEAVEAYEKLLATYRKSGDKSSEVAVLNNLANVHYYRGDYNSALKTMAEAEKFLEHLDDKENFFGPLLKLKLYAELKGTLGVIYTELGDFTLAYKHLIASRDYAEKTGNAVALRNAKFNLARLDYEQAHFVQAIREYKLLLPEAIKSGDQRLQCKLLNNLGLAELALLNMTDAEKSFKEALRLATLLRDKLSQANALMNLALFQQRLNSNEDADHYIRDAIALFRSIGNQAGVAHLMLAQVWPLLDAGRKMEAMKVCDEVLAMLKASGSGRYAAEAALILGLLKEENKQPAEAEKAYGDSLAAYRKLNDPLRSALVRLKKATIRQPDGRIMTNPAELADLGRDVARLNDPLLSLSYHTQLGWRDHANKAWKSAAQHYQAAYAIIESKAMLMSDPLYKAALQQELTGNFFALWAESLIALGDAAGAFRVAELGKSRSLRDLLERSQIEVLKGLTPDERATMIHLRESLTAATKRRASSSQFASNDVSRKELDQEAEAAELAYDTARRELYRKTPELQFRQARSDPADLPNVQRSLLAVKPDTVIVSYLIGVGRIVIIIVTAGDQPGSPAKVRFERVNVDRKALVEEAENLQISCLSPTAGSPASDKLWEWLIAPIEKDLEGKKHLVIVPSVPLLNLPFQALRLTDQPYLIEKIAISYSPSISTLVELRKIADAKQRNALTLPALTVGGVQFTQELHPLPASAAEATEIAHLFGNTSKLLLAGQATRLQILQRAGSAKVLHFATHGLPNAQRPFFSALAVTPANGDDGRLYAHDIMDLELHADLTVLSACNTSRGREFSGEGTVGLAWAFFVAGSSAVTVSQWSVADDTTAELMKAFYTRMRDDPAGNRASALQDAQLSILHDKKTKHPYYWAPFVLIGDWRK